MLATAESCTGGLLASLLTDVEGASHAFERGFVVCSEKAKCELLGIQQADITHCGAVSRTVALAMAQGSIHSSEAGIALSITVFAGERGGPGLVHIAWARSDGTVVPTEENF